MDDRELLERAAKAAGLTISWDARGAYIVADGVSGAGDVWNPLTDDGDALRLAVKLRIDLNSDDRLVAAEAPTSYDPAQEPRRTDPYAATRRAIVRAAAALADTIKEGK